METDFAGSTPRRLHEDGRADFSDDVKVSCTFALRPVLQEFKSQAAGRPIYEDVPMAQIRQRGERDVMERPVTDEDKARWPNAWRAFEAGMDHVESGTPLEVLFPAEPGMVKTLAAMHFRTVEQLAEASEQAIGKMGIDGRGRVNKAQRFMAAAHSTVPMHQLEQQMAQLAAKVQTLELANADLAKRNDELSKHKK